MISEMDASTPPKSSGVLRRRTRLGIAVAGGVVHGLLVLGARALVAVYVGEVKGCDDAGPCFAVGIDLARKLITAVPLLYLTALIMWAGFIWLLLRGTNRAGWRALGAAGWQVIAVPIPVILATAIAEHSPALGVAVVIASMTVLPAGLAWRASGLQLRDPIDRQPAEPGAEIAKASAT